MIKEETRNWNVSLNDLPDLTSDIAKRGNYCVVKKSYTKGLKVMLEVKEIRKTNTMYKIGFRDD